MEPRTVSVADAFTANLSDDDSSLSVSIRRKRRERDAAIDALQRLLDGAESMRRFRSLRSHPAKPDISPRIIALNLALNCSKRPRGVSW